MRKSNYSNIVLLNADEMNALMSNGVLSHWSDYDKNQANIHLRNCGWVIVDSHLTPIDNEYDLAEIYNMLETK